MSQFRGFLLKHFQLGGRFFGSCSAFSKVNLHPCKLFVGELDHPYLAIRWNARADALLMDFGVFLAGAVAEIDGILHHGKAVLEKAFAKVGVLLPSLFGIGREVEENDDPHTTVA